jgi:hypothetical protein
LIVGGTDNDPFGRAFTGTRVVFGNNSGETGLTFRSGTGTSSFLEMGSASTLLFSLSSNASSGTSLKTITAVPLLFGTDNAERARIDSSGNLLVGLTSAAVGGDTKTLQVAGWIAPRSTTVPGGGIGGSTLFAKERVYFGDNTGWTWDWYTVNTSGTTFRRFYFTDAGAAYNATGTWGSISDAKLKENIVDATPKLAGLMQVKVRNYNLIGETTKQIGVVAQELETIFPAMVENTVDKDAEGNELGTTTKAVKYSVFVPMLIKALQEQQAIIQTLTDRITALEQA